MTLHDEIHNECCEACKMRFMRHLSDCHLDCEGYIEEYAEIEADWKLEAKLGTERKDGNIGTKEG